MKNKTLQQLYSEHDGKVSDKWSLYLNVYDRVFSYYRNENISLLEIGVQNGGSLEIWSKYFSNAINLVGCDIDLKCSKLNYIDSRISVVVNNANSDDAEKTIIGILNWIFGKKNNE